MRFFLRDSCGRGSPPAWVRVLLGVGEGTAEVGGVGDGFEGEDRRFFTGEEGEFEGTALGERGDPEGGFGAAESVAVEEFLAGGDVDAVEAAGAASGGVGVECGADLGGLEGAGA